MLLRVLHVNPFSDDIFIVTVDDQDPVSCRRFSLLLERSEHFRSFSYKFSHPLEMSTHPHPTNVPGFDYQTRRHMWVEFVGSLLCSERFFSGYYGFLRCSETII